METITISSRESSIHQGKTQTRLQAKGTPKLPQQKSRTHLRN